MSLSASEDALVVVELPGGTPAAFPVAAVIEARELATQLGFGQREASAVKDLSTGAERLLDSKQLGELLGCDPTTVEAMARDGRLPSIRIGRLLRFEPALCLARLRVTDGGRIV